MTHLYRVKARHVAAAMLAAILGTAAQSASAQDFSFTLRAGLACDFKLKINGYGGNFHTEEFLDRNNNVVRTIAAGKGFGLVFTNTESGAEFALKGDGSVQRATINPDGSSTNVSTGPNVVILVPSDIPAGPSTTLYVGRFVSAVDALGIFTLQSATGASTDICAALST
jgi:hypothetical protein